MFRLGQHEKSGWQKIRDSWIWCYLFLGAVLTMPAWFPLLGI